MNEREALERALEIRHEIFCATPVRDETRDAHFALEELRQVLRAALAAAPSDTECHTSPAAITDSQTRHNAAPSDTPEGQPTPTDWRHEYDLLHQSAQLLATAGAPEGLREALREVRKDIIAAHYAGWDSERKLFAEAAVARIDQALGVRPCCSPERGGTMSDLPWAEKTAAHRLPPRECVKAARDALDRSYGLTDRAPLPLIIEALGWLRRACEQMADSPVLPKEEQR